MSATLEEGLRQRGGAASASGSDSETEDGGFVESVEKKVVAKALGSEKAADALFTLKAKLGVESWAELVVGLATLYALLGFILHYVGIPLPLASLTPLVACAFATYHIHIMGALSARLEQFSAENKRLQGEVNKLTDCVSSFQQQNAKLKGIADSLAGENDKFKHQVESLDATVKDLQLVQKTVQAYAEKAGADLGEVMSTLKRTLQRQEEVVSEQKVVLKETREATASQERILLLQLQSQCQFLDQNVGMSRQEHAMFVSMLPAKFRPLADEVGFSKMDTDADGVISVAELQAGVDLLVKKAAAMSS